ncbi:hypothetical protein BO94DRAFT_162084 [Aspergillus sclerotioniger CBS 115572]|uniref:Uncharacterized protein n=1 Tax=Aspergillus sclerotioniger CBS 115572 TaxID=1450535 RepID=A0A317W1V1_9EURO|nr:hypothetical protein BO94DRAFT_162084 [Aspergillus sclerotioniger CBS 115572]PWY80453.1 hypothetical protein BO94DRAFT_162084 [Aspergillus sclerotioniger CBS 115572]
MRSKKGLEFGRVQKSNVSFWLQAITFFSIVIRYCIIVIIHRRGRQWPRPLCRRLTWEGISLPRICCTNQVSSRRINDLPLGFG